MRIEYVYKTVYIYVPRAVKATAGMPAETAAINKAFDAMIEAAQDAQLKEKLKDLQKLVNRILGLISQIPSVGIRRMLMNMVGEIMDKVSKGDVSGALDLAGKTVKLAEDCKELCYHIQNNINALSNPTYVQGRAAGLLKALGQATQEAMDGASSLGELQEISDLSDRGVEIMRNLQSLDQKSPEYEQCCRELQGIMGAMNSMIKDPGMDLDQMQWQRQAGSAARDRLGQLREKTTDAFSLKTIDHLENAIGDILEASKALPGEQGEKAAKAIDKLLSQAGQGDAQGALREASQLAEKLKQLVKLRGFAEKRLGHLEKLGSEGIPGPAGESLNRVLTKLREALQNADSPEAVAKLDKQIEEALIAAGELKNIPPAQQVRHPAYRAMLGLERQLGPSSGGGSPGLKEPGAPGMGRDRFGSGRTGPIGRPVGTRPLDADILDALPLDGPRGRVSDEIKGLEGLGKGLPNAEDQEAACGCARRAAAALAGAEDAVDMAMIAMELKKLMDAAKALKNGDDPAANRAALEGGFPPRDALEPSKPAPAKPPAKGPTPIPPPPPRTPGVSEGLIEPPDVVETPSSGGSDGLVEPPDHQASGASAGLAPPPDVVVLAK